MAKRPAKRGYSAFMNSDHRDPLHDSRNAMTEWERSLRPRRERHWLMWVGLSALLMLGIAALNGCWRNAPRGQTG